MINEWKFEEISQNPLHPCACSVDWLDHPLFSLISFTDEHQSMLQNA